MQLKEFQETGELVRISMKDMNPYGGGVFVCILSPPSLFSAVCWAQHNVIMCNNTR